MDGFHTGYWLRVRTLDLLEWGIGTHDLGPQIQALSNGSCNFGSKFSVLDNNAYALLGSITMDHKVGKGK